MEIEAKLSLVRLGSTLDAGFFEHWGSIVE